MYSYLPIVGYFNSVVKKKLVICSFDLLVYPTVLITGSLNNAVQ